MTNYHLRPPAPQQPEQPQDDASTGEQHRKTAQRKAKRKAVLTRVWQQRARAYWKLLKRLKVR
jgi:hypothetical protein